MFKLRRFTKHDETIARPMPPTLAADPETPSRAVARSTTIEINQLLILRKPDSLVEMWCERCGAQNRWVTPETAALLTNQDTRSIYRRVESGALHFAETSAGLALVCLNSLLK